MAWELVVSFLPSQLILYLIAPSLFHTEPLQLRWVGALGGCQNPTRQNLKDVFLDREILDHANTHHVCCVVAWKKEVAVLVGKKKITNSVISLSYNSLCNMVVDKGQQQVKLRKLRAWLIISSCGQSFHTSQWIVQILFWVFKTKKITSMFEKYLLFERNFYFKSEPSRGKWFGPKIIGKKLL